MGEWTEIWRRALVGADRAHPATIEQILADEREAPPKQRHTARRISSAYLTSTANRLLLPPEGSVELGRAA